jgi:hypothetical protein
MSKVVGKGCRPLSLCRRGECHNGATWNVLKSANHNRSMCTEQWEKLALGRLVVDIESGDCRFRHSDGKEAVCKSTDDKEKV